MTARRRVRRWLRKWVGNPIATVVLAALLVGDSFTLGRDWRYTPLGGPVIAVFGKARTAPTVVDPYGPELYVVRTATDLRVIDPSVDSWDELSSLFSTGEVPIVACVFTDHTTRSGFWAQTNEKRFRGVVLAPASGEWSDEDLGAARAVLFEQDHVPTSTWSAIKPWTDVTPKDHREWRLLWGGVCHNALALGLLTLLVYSFTGWPAWFAAHPISRNARRRLRGLCPACGYDLQGTDGAKCPECGKSEPRA